MKKLFITLMICASTISVVVAQNGISISNFSAENVSSSELLITVDYRFSRKISTKGMIIQAFPVMKEGKANYKGVLFESHSLEVGDHQVSFKISKKLGGKDFNSGSIRVCMINGKSIILCEEFPFTMSWNEPETTSTTEIISFTSSDNFVEIGETVTLSWQTENASKVRLGRAGTTDFGEVPASGSETVVIDRTSTYVLMASPESSKGPTKVESKKIKIEVTNNQPVIGSFYASHPAVRRGIESKLLWKAFGANQVTLNGEPVQAIGDLVVSPMRTTAYVLRVQTADKMVEETLSIYVTPFAAPVLSDPIYSLELCKRVDTNNGYSKCISSDGPFTTGDKIFLMARFKNLPKGNYKVKRITYRGFFGKDQWTKAHQEESGFENPGRDEGLLIFPIVNLGEGAKKLKIMFNDNKETISEIIYCVDCSRVWD